MRILLKEKNSLKNGHVISIEEPKRLSHEKFKKIYDQHIGYIQFYLRKLNMNKEETDDITQEIFLRLYKNLSKIESKKIRSFLTVTARNLVIDNYRIEMCRKTFNSDSDTKIAMENVWKSNPQRELELQLLSNIIENISKSNGGECFRLFYEEGLSFKEISHKLDLPIGTVTSKVYRLREKFRFHIHDKISQVREDAR